MSVGSQESCRAGCIQLASGNDRQTNLELAATLIDEAAGEGCDIVLLPENFSFMGANDNEKLAVAEEQDSSLTLRFLSQQAATHRMTIIGGTLPLKAASTGKVRNSCPLFSPNGEMLACYDKIHLFDVTLPDEQYRESDSVAAGAEPVSVDSGDWKIGLSVCYDLRFPELYRHYSSIGCTLLSVPAAFTVPTGKSHWQTLLKARAIENQCYLLAAGQCGSHPGGRKTWGHSMIIDAWGETLAEAENETGIIVADLSLNKLAEIRQAMPVLSHRRM